MDIEYVGFVWCEWVGCFVVVYFGLANLIWTFVDSVFRVLGKR